MSKIYCAYDHSRPNRAIATHRCDTCGKLLCIICGYRTEKFDYCNECWAIKMKEEEDERDKKRRR